MPGVCLVVRELKRSKLARRGSVPRLRASAGLYRRFLTCRAFEPWPANQSVRFAQSEAFRVSEIAQQAPGPQDEILRYCRLKTCATFRCGHQKPHLRNRGYPQSSPAFGSGYTRLVSSFDFPSSFDFSDFGFFGGGVRANTQGVRRDGHCQRLSAPTKRALSVATCCGCW